MPPDTLEFEEPIAVLLKEVEALSMLPPTPQREAEIERLNRRIESIRGDIYSRLTPWQRVLVARHPNRPTVLDYVNRMFTEFTEISGDRRFADDRAIVAGFARYKDEPVMIVGHHKGAGGDTKQKIFRNFGYARPEGYRKALRAMKLAEKFGRAVIAFVDTPAAYPGDVTDLEHLGPVRIVVVVHGEGGSGGALGIAIGDRILMHEFAIYSVIPPEGCAAILWRDAARKVEAAEALRLTAPDLLRFGIVDEIVPEPIGGAHTNHELATSLLDAALERTLADVSAMDPASRLEQRYQKFRQMGNVGINEG